MSASEESAILILTTVVDAWKEEVSKGKTFEFQETRVETIFVTKDISERIMTEEAVECESDIHPKRDSVCRRRGR